jgi:hypothetical protein
MEDKDQTSYPHSLASVSSFSITHILPAYTSCCSLQLVSLPQWQNLSLSLSLCLALVDTYASALNTTFYRLFKWQLEFNKGRLHYFFINAPNRGELQLTLQLLVAIIIATFLPLSFVKVR